jgi:hypothetical protein
MGDFCHVMVLVIDHRPGFLTACASAKIETAKRQQPSMTPTCDLFILPPDQPQALTWSTTTLSDRWAARYDYFVFL